MSQEGLKFRVRGLRGFGSFRDVGLILVGWSSKIQTRHTRSWLSLYYSDITTLLVIGVSVLVNSPVIYVRLVPTKMSLYIHSCWSMFSDGTRESSSWAPVTVDRVPNLMHSTEGCTLYMFQAVFPCSCLREPFGLKSSGWPPVLTLTSRQLMQDILMTALLGFVGTFLGTDGAVVLPKASPGLPCPLMQSAQVLEHATANTNLPIPHT